ncbi:urea ABC transporter ATP-binding subunit UrtE [Methylocella silvestris]|uniref:Urea ABC transporter ATP-binding subunit UrtE n=1 Tax=Methylocella silvestris TaxID=199596 RepID=A0A2J7TDN6_METSI|nr:urea ABC transporter ATP-binding subunit UrtE [Methylocella silvestris]PNG24878.1 urea ABC transporter ATP-binding subunit UrtE [Methylocella silvestris]
MLLGLDHVTSFYGKTPILKDIGFDLHQGQCLCVLGRNGVGKTTLLRTIMGLTDRMTGDIQMSGANISTAPTHQRAKYGLGYIPQGRQILAKFTVKENILLGTFARSDGLGEVPPLCLSLFPYLAENLEKQAGLLSGGQQQQLAIARALATNPKILLLDEPTEGIQPNIVHEIGQTLRRLNTEFGITLILTEQHIKVARKLGDAFLMMENGRIVARGPIAEMTDELVERHMTI